MPSLLEQSSVLTGPSPLAAPTIPKPAPPAAPQMRDFGDAATTRRLIYDNVLNTANNLEPVSNRRHTLRLSGVEYADPDEYNSREQKRAILEGRTLSRRLRGTWQLWDNTTGQVVDQRKQTIAAVPYFTNRGTFIHNGNEYTLSNQMRLRPGIFTRRKDNGEIEAHINVLPGKGVSHRYFLDPAKSVFYAKIHQAKIPLLPLLRVLGAQDAQLREAWGGDILAANMLKDDPSAIRKIYDRIVKRRDPDADDMGQRQALIEAVNTMELDPEVVKRTLGKPHDRLNLDTLLATTKKLLAISRGEQDVDDRDHLAFQTVVGPEDLLSERLAKDYGSTRRNLLTKLSFKGNLAGMPPNALSRQLESALLHSGLGQSLEEINPADVFDKQSRVSRLGEGGIPSIDSVPDEARSVQPSHFAFIDPIRTPESFRVGVDVHLARGARKGADGKIYAPFNDPKTGQTVYKSPQDVADLAVGFPGVLRLAAYYGQKRVPVMKSGRIRFVKKQDVDLTMPHFENAFSPLGNMIPFKSATKGQRVAMGSRMITQALPLTDPEAPLVQSGMPKEDRSFEDEYGRHMGAVRASRSGRVMRADQSGLHVRYDDGNEETLDLYENFPYNRKTFIHQTPTLKPGDVFKPGDLLAKSNYTDGKGVTALGKNARVAYIPFRGLNFEDAVVISSSFAKRLSSEHMYQNRLDWDDDIKRGKQVYDGLFPGRYDRKTMLTIDDDGAVKPGAVVNYGDPLVLAAKRRSLGQHKVHRKGTPGFTDASVTWKHHSPGVVTDVVKTKNGISVVVKSASEMQVGDKLSGRYGDKGVVASIIPDDQMPRGRDGQPFEILLNPLGIITRTNPAQKIEAALGKIAAMRGEPYRVPDFEDIDDLTEFAKRELQKYGLKDRDDIIDPETGRKISGIYTGNRFFMKLHHTAEGKGQGRGTGGYTQDETPAKGGESGSKRVSLMDTNALLSHGATAVLRDASAVRGQRNEDYWLSFMQGHTPPDPKVPMVYRKFVNELKAAGINVVPDGGKLNVMAMTDSDIDHMAGDREITSGDTVHFEKGLKPIEGGLFDPKLTGGHHGNRWSFIRLPEPMPNPVMEEPIRRVLGLTQKQFEEVLAGKEKIQGATGPAAIKHALDSINLPRELAVARAQSKGSKKTLRDAANRKLGYLKHAERLGIHPRDWMLTKVPVLPPVFRPISVMEQNKLPLVADANYLYKELLDANDNLKAMQEEVDDVGEERLAVYNAFKAVTGLGDPLHPKLQEKNVQGVLKHIFGSSPKLGTVQRRLISSTVDLVGRAVITPNPDLDMDSVGLPESRAWEVYKPFIVRRLHRRGLPLLEAAKQFKDRTKLAREELLGEMSERPVFINRAPVLHRFGIMAFWPKLTKEDTLQVSPLIVSGFGADFDGDAMQYHVPVDEKAKQEAVDRMLPSRNLLSPADFKTPMHKPGQEYVGGLYSATEKPKKPGRPHRFLSRKDAVHAYLRGDIPIDAVVEIDE